VVIGDVRDASALRSVVIDCAAVLHLAAQVAVTTSLDDPVSDFTSNALGTLNVLEAVRRYNSSAPVLFASTNKVYGKGVADHHFVRRAERYEPRDHRLAKGVSEQSPLDLYSPYGCSKGAADQYVHDYARVFGLRSVVMRMSCIYGPRQFGTEDQGWLAHFLMQALRGEPITIYGDGCQVRDALFVDDAVNAWITALDRIEHVAGRVFNLGGGPANAISLLEAIDRITHLHGRRPDIQFKDWRHGDQLWYVSDIRAIATALDWAPRVSLDKGLRQLDRWICERIPDQAPAPRLQEAGA
jgi:CDP-paratose 2-epimerase